MLRLLIVSASLLLATPVWAQSQQRNLPSAPQNDSQALQNQSQQPSIAREVSPTAPTATENSVTKPQGPTTGPTSQSPTGRSK